VAPRRHRPQRRGEYRRGRRANGTVVGSCVAATSTAGRSNLFVSADHLLGGSHSMPRRVFFYFFDNVADPPDQSKPRRAALNGSPPQARQRHLTNSQTFTIAVRVWRLRARTLNSRPPPWESAANGSTSRHASSTICSTAGAVTYSLEADTSAAGFTIQLDDRWWYHRFEDGHQLDLRKHAKPQTTIMPPCRQATERSEFV